MSAEPLLGNSRGSALVISLVLTLLLVALGTTLLSVSGLESEISHNDLWSEGAFQAAESGLHAGIDQIVADPVISSQPIPVTDVTDDYAYRSGGRTDSSPQPIQYLGNERQQGYSIAVGTGYNPSGYAFARYRINATGTAPRNTRREVEALAQYGPVPE